ncbi:helix-turn-helix transcriptional regulator [Plantactinospora sp. B5E13]|uniref:helix-turn-helix domain-containing protein n=1 Tax=unclassified Plantactinospora TaxID=2631981 RepID=UPI00325D48F3
MPHSRLTALLAATLRQQRERHGLTQAGLAERTGLNQSTITRIEQGSRAPGLPMLERLFAALDLQLAFRVEPLDAHLDARIDELRRSPTTERIGDLRLDLMADRLGELPYVWTGSTAALLQGAPLPDDDLEINVRWSDADQFTAWLTRNWAERWNARWEEFGFVRIDPREPGEHRWRVVGGVVRARMCDELPETIEVRHGGRSYQVVPLALVEVTDPATAALLRRWRERQAG